MRKRRNTVPLRPQDAPRRGMRAPRLPAALAGWPRRSALLAAAAVLLAALLALAGGLAAGGGGDVLPGGGLEDDFDATRAEASPYDGRSPRLPARNDRERVIVALARPSLGEKAAERERRGLPPLTAAAQRRYVNSLAAEQRALRSGLEARGVTLGGVLAFKRVFNGFAADVRTRDLPALTSQGLRPSPVRRFFPAGTDPIGAVTAPRARRNGVEVALLDTAASARPREGRAAERHGQALGALLAAGGARVRFLQVAQPQAGEDGTAELYGTTDTLIDALEDTVDPDRDTDAEDALPLAVVGVASPYASFANTPEVVATDAAAALGTLVVAPSGNEGPGEGAHGLLASPAGAAGALAVAPQTRRDAVPRVPLRLGEDVEVPDAAVLGGPPAPARLPRGATVVRADGNPAGQVSDAAAHRAELVVLADPRENAVLPALPAGRSAVPVLGVTGDAAKAVLEARGEGRVGAVRIPGARGRLTLARTAARGPALDGTPKPDLQADGTARLPGGGWIAGGSVAAARVALRAASVLAEEPDLPPAILRERLLGDAARRTTPGGAPVPAPGPPRLGELALTRRGGRVTGVRFAVGRFERGDVALGRSSRLEPVDRLELTLVTAEGRRVRRLTPRGGARALLPASYAYAFPTGQLGALPAGRYAFAVRAWAPRDPDTPAAARSAPFEVR